MNEVDLDKSDKTYGMDITILRLSNVYGPNSIHKESVISKFIKLKLNNKPITIYGTGHQARDFIHVSDVCRAIHECYGEYYEISTGQLTSINTIAEMIGCKVEHSDPINGELFHPETKQWSGYKIDIKDGLESTIRWFEENYR